MKNLEFQKYLPPVLILLIIIDTLLALIGFFFPSFWFSLQHGDPNYVDTQGLLIHSAYFWATYAVLQTVGLFSWSKNKFWIHTFLTIRIVDNFLISSYILSDHLLLTSAKIVLYGVLPANLILAYFFWKCLESP